MDKSYFLSRKSRVNKCLEQAPGQFAAAYQIQPFGKRPQTRFGLGLEAGLIVIE
jgi:hypothetical protein